MEIKVYFHVINQGSGLANGDVPETTLDQQITILNNSFSVNTGGANTPFRFVKACVNRINNPSWFNMGTPLSTPTSRERAAKSALHRGGATDLNFYTINDTNDEPRRTSNVNSAWARFPWEYTTDQAIDGIVVPYTMLPGGTRPSFGGGDIAVHEVGHWLGLFHTYSAYNPRPEDVAAICSNTSLGDQVTDTPPHIEFPEDVGSACVTGRDTCTAIPGLDPSDNFMTDTSDACKSRFTSEQSCRMDTMYGQHRQPNSCDSPVQCGVSTTASIAWIAPAEDTWGQPNTMTAAGYAQNGCGNVQLVWRDTTISGPWNVVEFQAIPSPTDGSWSNTIPSPYKCHNFEAYVNYSGIRWPTFSYNGQILGYCDETVAVIWIQPAESGTSGNLRVAGSATGAPSGTPVYLWYRNITAGTGWARHPYAPTTLPDGIWLNDIPNANFSHRYEVRAEYDVVTATCTYQGTNSITWCP
ncbi:MAG TPA: zinc metalloprotease [Blastocatellia bacterium]